MKIIVMMLEFIQSRRPNVVVWLHKSYVMKSNLVYMQHSQIFVMNSCFEKQMVKRLSIVHISALVAFHAIDIYHEKHVVMLLPYVTIALLTHM